ncbi:efflux RND transporter periplasmic adaptor subunit [Pseudomonas sp. M30-35]|uniref:efflux RND transporter periplasmic adaptor subunit n=1 Tax=Pseudomonas sp. M30-35 TaxID=1981174 RepID=UPI000B3CFDF7|nr:HlyD family efflux transporter periplasmic adaptor subunit [Pseudomonas sp. M30-35]ARU86674.1 hypothetical protein B9K09_01130 [Pseudomonas sp. M30-35]
MAEADPIIKRPDGTASSGAGEGGLAALLQYEAELRRHAEVPALHYFLANESGRVVGYDQLFIMRRSRFGSGFEIVTVSSLATVDRNAPLIHAIEQEMNARLVDEAATQVMVMDVSSYTNPEQGVEMEIRDYPFHHWLWQPLMFEEGPCFGGLLLARTNEFSESEKARLARIAETASHAWRALTHGHPVRQIRKPTKRQTRILLGLLVVVLLFPVRMSALAPVEVVAARPFALTAPVDGVISRIHVVPNALVEKGQLLVSFDDLKLSNELQLAEDQVAIAKARAERANIETFTDHSRAREMSITRAELELARADLSYAKAMYERRNILAPRAGMAIYSDRRDWEGRAVSIGEPIMQLSDPQDVLFRINLPAREQMALAPGNKVKVFLDIQPLWSLTGRLETASYQARMTPDEVMAFALTARPVGDVPRIGSRGTARVYGRWVPLAYSLFRRPIASFRQFIGF